MADLNSRGWRMDGVIRPEARRIGCHARRQAVRYNLAERADLLAQFEAGARIADIAYWHERSPNGVSMQLAQMGVFVEA